MSDNPLTNRLTLDKMQKRAEEYDRMRREGTLPFDPLSFSYTGKTTWGQIEQWSRESPGMEVVYAVGTCWWSLYKDEWMPYTKPAPLGGIPCDPRGSMLMQGELSKFIGSAVANQSHYGKHGLLALAAAFHGNVIHVRSGLPTSFEGWEKYNLVLDRHGAT